MAVMTRDPKFIAEQLKLLRKIKGLKQQNVAAITGLSTRTIEKVESGDHVPSDQTLQMIARAFGMENTSFFDKPSEADQQRMAATLDRARRKTVAFPIAPIRTEHDVIALFTGRHMYGFDISTVENGAAMTHAAEMIDWIKDYADTWPDLSMVEQVDAARKFASLCSEMERHGYVCETGCFRQQQMLPNRKRWVVTVALITFIAKAQSETTGHAMTTLSDAWETCEEDRIKLNEA